jgi:hypothetical protein
MAVQRPAVSLFRFACNPLRIRCKSLYAKYLNTNALLRKDQFVQRQELS